MSLATLSDICVSYHEYSDPLLIFHCLCRPLLIEHIISDIDG